MKNVLRAVLLSGALLIGLAGPAMASTRHTAASTSSASTKITNASTTATKSLAESRAVKWLLDQVAITKVELSPGTKRFVNLVLKLTLPAICPLMARAAEPSFADLVKTQCTGIAAAADPWEALKAFTPLLCTFGDFVFPKYTDLLKVGCGLLL